MKTSNYLLILGCLLVSCNSQIPGEIADPEQERATAFMSGMIQKDGAWVTSVPNFDKKDFVFDITTSDFPYHLNGSTSGTNYLRQIQLADRSQPESTWKEKYQQALETFTIIENETLGEMVSLINYELVTFPFLRYYLGLIEATPETAEAVAHLLPLLVQKGTRGELDLMAENLKKHAPSMTSRQKEELLRLIETRCEETLKISVLEPHRREKTLKALKVLKSI